MAHEHPVRIAAPADAGEVARLLHDFNTEYGDPTPGIPALTERCARLIERDQMDALVGGEPACAVAVLRYRASLWTTTDGALDAYLEELYVAPPERGRGLGRALLETALERARERGAVRCDLATSVDDTAAIGLYESAGFTNREGLPDGPAMIFYEREL